MNRLEVYQQAIKSETAEKMGINNTPDFIITQNIEWLYDVLVSKLYDKYGRHLVINSWYRCPELNRAVGGSKTSLHMQGLAVDFYVIGKEIEVVFNEIFLTEKIINEWHKVIVYPKHKFMHISRLFATNEYKMYYSWDKRHYKELEL